MWSQSCKTLAQQLKDVGPANNLVQVAALADRLHHEIHVKCQLQETASEQVVVGSVGFARCAAQERGVVHAVTADEGARAFEWRAPELQTRNRRELGGVRDLGVQARESHRHCCSRAEHQVETPQQGFRWQGMLSEIHCFGLDVRLFACLDFMSLRPHLLPGFFPFWLAKRESNFQSVAPT